MTKKSYREVLREAGEIGVAIGHFNISDIAGLWTIVRSAEGLNVPVIIGVSEGERDYIGVKETVALVRSVAGDASVPVFLNADHTYSFERVKEAIDAGFDSAIFDGAKLGMEENTKITKQCVDYARDYTKRTGRDVLIEGELGYIGTSSMMLDKIPVDVAVKEGEMTTPEEAKRFVESTGVDLFAPSVGNIHGMLRNCNNPELSIDRIREIVKVVNIPLVLHGGSGIREQNFRDAIEAGIDVVHINTELRVAWHEATQRHLMRYPDDIAPYKVGKSGLEAMQKVVTDRLKLFSGIDK